MPITASSGAGAQLRVVERVIELREVIASRRRAGASIALVPTMGYMHDGHLSLIREARRRADVVVVSLFVNPLQFAPTDDLSRYPRDFAGDRDKAAAGGVDVLFAPTAEEVYHGGMSVEIRPTALAGRWEGAARPGHFEGVLTVVAKLFNLVQPDVAVFGQKDFQQSALVRAMVRDLDFPIEIIVAPTVRERDGLALSSRNAYLSADDRVRALSLSRALQAARDAFAQGERDARVLEQRGRAVLDAEASVRVDYFAIASASTLEPVDRAEIGSVAMVAARVGATRLIDNMVLGAP